MNPSSPLLPNHRSPSPSAPARQPGNPPLRRRRPRLLSHHTLNQLAAAAFALAASLLASVPAASQQPAPAPATTPATTTAAAISTSATAATPSTNRGTLVVILGTAGDPALATNFLRQAELWKTTSQRARLHSIPIGLDSSPSSPASTNNPSLAEAIARSSQAPSPDALPDLEILRRALDAEPKSGPNPLWLVFIGHGNFDGRDARFNLRGPDLSSTNLAAWLKPFQRPVAIVNNTASSAPFLNKLSASNRVVITATRSGHEQNYARFGNYFADAIADPKGDLDQDGQTSLLEAFLSASYRVAEFYKTEGRLATEHALIDDNGDGMGTPAEWFKGVRATRKAKDGATLDGTRAHQWHLIPSPDEERLSPEQRARRDALELELVKLRDIKSKIPEAEYLQRIETLLLELARIQFPSK